MKPRPIDHLVLAVRDLEAGREAYRRLGFTLTPVARHPFGTANSLVQLAGGFLEILAVADPAAIAQPTATSFSFAAFNRDFLARREGLSMLALASPDAAADREDFARRGLPVYDPFGFERTAKTPEGVERNVAFSLTYTGDRRIRDAGFFTCQHHFPENFWRAEYQRHANGADHIAAAVFVTRDPVDFHEFLTAFTGQHEIVSTSLGLEFALGSGKIEVRSPTAFRAFFGEDAGPDPRRFTGYRVAVRELSATRTLLATNRVPFGDVQGAIVVPSAFAHGAVLAFVEG